MINSKFRKIFNEYKLKNDENLAFFLNEVKSIKTSNFERKIRIAILGSSTLNGIEETIRVKCFQKGIECITYVGDYNQYNQEILNQDSGLYQFKPDITFLILDTRHIIGEHFFSWHTVSHDQKSEFMETKINEIKKLCNTFGENSESKLILTSLQIPSYSSYGISEQREIRGLKEMVSEINNELFDQAQKLLIDLEYNEEIGKILRSLIENSQNTENFEKFYEILENSSKVIN